MLTEWLYSVPFPSPPDLVSSNYNNKNGSLLQLIEENIWKRCYGKEDTSDENEESDVESEEDPEPDKGKPTNTDFSIDPFITNNTFYMSLPVKEYKAVSEKTNLLILATSAFCNISYRTQSSKPFPLRIHKLSMLHGFTQYSEHCIVQKQNFRWMNSGTVCLLFGNVINCCRVSTKALICGTNSSKQSHQKTDHQCNSGINKLINYGMTMQISMNFSSISFGECYFIKVSKMTTNHSTLVMLLQNIRQTNVATMFTRSNSS